MQNRVKSRLAAISCAALLSLAGVATTATAHAAPLPFPFSGSSDGSSTPPPLQESQHSFTVAWRFNYPVNHATDSIRIVLNEKVCASSAFPGNQDYTPIEQNETLLFQMTDNNSVLDFPCQSRSTEATWQVFTKSRLGTDVTTIRFTSLRNNNELEWTQSTESGRSGTVYIDRVATGLVLNVFNLP